MSGPAGARALALLSVGAVVPAGFVSPALCAEAGAQPLALTAGGDVTMPAERGGTSGASLDDSRWRLPHGARGVHAAWTDLDVALDALERFVGAHSGAEAERRRLEPLLDARRRLRDEGGAWLGRREESAAPVSAQRSFDGLDTRLAALAHGVAHAYARTEYTPIERATTYSRTGASSAVSEDGTVEGAPHPADAARTGAGDVRGRAFPLDASGTTVGAAAAPAGGFALPPGTSDPAPSTGAPPLPETARGYLATLVEAMFSPSQPSETPAAPGPDGPAANASDDATTGPFPWGRALVALAAVTGACLWLLGIRALLKRTDRHAKALERRLKRVAAPLTGPVASDVKALDAESVFRPRERDARLAWVWRPITRLYPLVDPPRALAIAMGAGAAFSVFAWGALWFLKVPAGWWSVTLVGVAGALGAWQALRWQQARQAAAFIRQFPEIVDQMVRLAGAGVPSVEALTVVAADAQDPVRPVLNDICDGLVAGLDPDRALRLGTERVRMAEFTLFAAVLRLQRRSGGAISGAFANLAGTLRERSKTALKAHASTAQTRLTLLVLSVMPVLVLVGQKFTAPASVEMLFSTDSGTTLLRVGTGLIVTGLLVARAIAARAAR